MRQRVLRRIAAALLLVLAATALAVRAVRNRLRHQDRRAGPPRRCALRSSSIPMPVSQAAARYAPARIASRPFLVPRRQPRSHPPPLLRPRLPNVPSNPAVAKRRRRKGHSVAGRPRREVSTAGNMGDNTDKTDLRPEEAADCDRTDHPSHTIWPEVPMKVAGTLASFAAPCAHTPAFLSRGGPCD